MTIGEKLKKLREDNGLTRKDVAHELKKLGIDISDKTLYGYESGRNSANADMFLALCKIYKCNNVMEVFSDFTSDVLFTNAEWKVIEKYRSLDTTGQNHVDTLMDWESDRSAAASEQADRISALERQPASVIEFQPKSMLTGRMIEYFHSASAGSGVFILGNEITDQIAIPDTPENRKIDYAIKVSGNSMEPDYKDGEIALISQKMELRHGDIGIFIVNNAAYIKEYGETELISRNPSADNIKISEYDNIVCMGKVVGKLKRQ